eukprot:scaffold23069_cov36-Tisochrysis_lutea.AAC.6
MVKIGHSKKYVEYFSASSVADVQMSFRSLRRASRPFKRPKSTSVCMVRSCACDVGCISAYRQPNDV